MVRVAIEKMGLWNNINVYWNIENSHEFVEVSALKDVLEVINVGESNEKDDAKEQDTNNHTNPEIEMPLLLIQLVFLKQNSCFQSGWTIFNIFNF